LTGDCEVQFEGLLTHWVSEAEKRFAWSPRGDHVGLHDVQRGVGSYLAKLKIPGNIVDQSNTIGGDVAVVET